MNKKENMILNSKFRYNNSEYLLLINNKCQRFYLKINNNNVDYVTMEEYININNTLFSAKFLTGYKRIEVKPLIKIKNKLISLSLATSILLSLSGCAKGNDKTINGLSEIGIETSIISNDYDIYKVTGANLDNKTKYGNVDFSFFSDTPFSVICTPSIFGDYVGKSNISYNDLKNTIKNNDNIPKDVKNIINEGIENLEKENFNMNYSVLDYNLERLTVEYVDPQEINNNAGIFDAYTSTAKINKEIKDKLFFSKEILIHEIIGHGSTRAYDKEKGIYCDVTVLYLNIDENGSISDAYNYGAFGVEGIADIITSIANKKKIKTNDAGYTTNVYELSTLCSSVGITVEDYANNGIEYLTNKMLEQGIDNPYQIITSLDNTALLLQQNSLIQSNSTSVFIDYYKELSESNLDIDTLKKSTIAYSDYVDIEKIGDLNVIIKLIDEDTFDLIQPEIVTDYVNSLEKSKSY